METRWGKKLEEEFTVNWRKVLLRRLKIWAIISGIIFGVLIASAYWVWYDSRHYTWYEHRAETIERKWYEDEYEYVGTDEDGNSEYEWVTYYYFELSNYGSYEVSFWEYTDYNVGETYTFSIRHYDWKPDADPNAPMPPAYWVIILMIPTIIVANIMTILFLRYLKERKEFILMGDTVIDGGLRVEEKRMRKVPSLAHRVPPPQAVNTRECPICGAQIGKSHLVCPECGGRLL